MEHLHDDEKHTQERDWLSVLSDAQCRIMHGSSSDAYLLIRDLIGKTMPMEIQVELLDLLGACLTELSRYSSALDAYEKSIHLRSQYGLPYRRTVLGLVFSALRSLQKNKFNIAIDFIEKSNLDVKNILYNIELEVEILASNKKCLWDPYFVGVGEYLSPQQLQVWNDVLIVYRLGEIPKVLSLIQQVRDEQFFSLPVDLFMVKILEESGQFDEAQMTVEEVLSNYPKSWRAFYWAGRLAYNHRDYNRAEELFKEAINLYADSGEAWYLLATSLGRLGMIEEAVQAYLTALPLLKASGPPLSLRELAFAEGGLAGYEISMRRYLRGLTRSFRSLRRIARFVFECQQTLDEIKQRLVRGDGV